MHKKANKGLTSIQGNGKAVSFLFELTQINLLETNKQTKLNLNDLANVVY